MIAKGQSQFLSFNSIGLAQAFLPDKVWKVHDSGKIWVGKQ
jgi:hypothetical protein